MIVDVDLPFLFIVGMWKLKSCFASEQKPRPFKLFHGKNKSYSKIDNSFLFRALTSGMKYPGKSLTIRQGVAVLQGKISLVGPVSLCINS